MIMRIWHGMTLEEKKDEYFNYILDTGVKYYRAREGNLGVYVLMRVEDGKADFLLLSLWDSWESIRNFAGRDLEKAVYLFPLDREFLLEMEPKVRHYEILAGPWDVPDSIKRG
jgi:heme-degrading monooxygenase HmoA